MGDRGNIVIRQEDGDVWMYTHWHGEEVPEVVRRALAKEWRWDDAPYLARIIFCELVKGREDQETGFGLSTGLLDNEHDICVVDVTIQHVAFVAEASLSQGQLPRPYVPIRALSFRDYIAQQAPHA